MSFTIVTDTTSNLDAAFLRENAVVEIALSYTVDGAEHFAAADAFDSEAYYAAIRSGTRVTTSQVPPQRFVDVFTPILERGADILFLGLSSGVSGSYSSCRLAINELRFEYPERRIEAVDTLGSSFGVGFLVMLAAQRREEGVSLDDVAAEIAARRGRLCQLMAVDDLMYLKRTGRVAGATAFVGSMLGIKPILVGTAAGQLEVTAKPRGRKQMLRAMAERYGLVADPSALQTVAITHAGCREDAETLASLLKEYHPPEKIIITALEPVSGAHAGPGAVGLFFWGGPQARRVRWERAIASSLLI